MYFYRFEFQNRSTVHVHMLVWLHNIKQIHHELVHADIPRDKPDSSYLVHKFHPSDKKAHCLKMQNERSFLKQMIGKQHMI